MGDYFASIAKGNLLPGKTYYLKVNVGGAAMGGHFRLGVADSDDPRVDRWVGSLTPVIIKKAPKSIPAKYLESVRLMVQKAEENKINYEHISDKNAM